MIVRRVAAVAALLVAAIVLSAAPSYGGADVFDAWVSKKVDGPFTGNSVDINVGSGKAKSVYFKVKSKYEFASITELMKSASGNGEGYKQRWYKLNGKNITAAVKDGGFAIHLDPFQARKFRLKVIANDSPPDQYCSATLLDDVSGDDFTYLFVHVNGGPCS